MSPPDQRPHALPYRVRTLPIVGVVACVDPCRITATIGTANCLRNGPAFRDLNPKKWTAYMTIWPLPAGARYAQAVPRRASAQDL